MEGPTPPRRPALNPGQRQAQQLAMQQQPGWRGRPNQGQIMDAMASQDFSGYDLTGTFNMSGPVADFLAQNTVGEKPVNGQFHAKDFITPNVINAYQREILGEDPYTKDGFIDGQARRLNKPTINLDGVDVSGQRLVFDTNSTGYQLQMKNANLSNADLSGNIINYGSFSGSHLNGANLTSTRIRNSDFSGAQMGGAHMDDAIIMESNLDKINLRYLNLNTADFRGSSLKEADLRDTEMNGTKLHGAELNNAQVQNAYMMNVKGQGANFSGVDFTKIRTNEIDDASGISPIQADKQTVVDKNTKMTKTISKGFEQQGVSMPGRGFSIGKR